MSLISGHTRLIAHIGYPTHSFKAPLIYNPYFERENIDCVVVPLGCQAADFPQVLRAVFRLTNICGALITMPHKVSTVGLLDEASPAVHIAGACNAVRRTDDGRLVGDLFDGEGFVRGVRRKGVRVEGARVLVVGAGGVGSAIAASFAAAGVGAIGLFDVNAETARGLSDRLCAHYPRVQVCTSSNDPADWDIVVNATPMGMAPGDPLPLDVNRLAPATFVGEVVMRTTMTAFLEAARQRGCRYQVGTDMLFEQIPAYLEFFGLPSTTAEVLREVARLG
jgi:shikimate dehydrogenase